LYILLGNLKLLLSHRAIESNVKVCNSYSVYADDVNDAYFYLLGDFHMDFERLDYISV